MILYIQVQHEATRQPVKNYEKDFLFMKYYQEQDVLIMERIHELLEDLPDYMRTYVSYMSTGSVSKRTIQNYVYDIRGFIEYIAEYRNLQLSDISAGVLEQLTNFDFDAYFHYIDSYKKRSYKVSEIKRSNGTSGKSRKLSSLRSLYKYLQQYRLIEKNPILGYGIRLKQQKPNITAMNVEEVNTLMRTVEAGDLPSKRQKIFAEKNKYRDTALLSIMLNTGIRVSECVGIDLDDINWKESKLVVHRKGGGNDPNVYLNTDVIQSLKDYVQLERTPNEENEPALFLNRTGGRLSRMSIDSIVKKYAARAVPGKHITPHKLRSTFGTNLYQATGDIHLTSQALNHSSIEVTASRYADVDLKQRKDAVNIIEKRYHDRLDES
jgi:site-specific recombinase XerD